MDSQVRDTSPIFDSLDVDLVVKVLSHTVFSPFFIFFIPLFYISQGRKVDDPIILACGVYLGVLSLFWSLKWISTLYRNQGNLLFAPPQLDWDDQVVVITGGASGVGELLANTLSVRNVSVVVLDVNPIVTDNYNITYYKCDVSKWEEVEAVSKQIIEEVGTPTMLINNAGVVQGKLLLDLTPEDVQQTFGVNVMAHFWTLKAFLPGMIARKSGHIVTMSSLLGRAGVAQMTDYNASKAALINLNESLRYELDKRQVVSLYAPSHLTVYSYKCPGIRTTLILPGLIQTPMFRTVRLPTNPIHKFFLPVVGPVDIVKRIIRALDDQHSQTVVLPLYGQFMPLLQFLPSYLRDFCQWITGADEALLNFVKVSGLRSDEGDVTESKK